MNTKRENTHENSFGARFKCDCIKNFLKKYTKGKEIPQN